MSNKIMGISITIILILFILEYSYMPDYLKVKDIIRLIILIIFFTGLGLLIVLFE